MGEQGNYHYSSGWALQLCMPGIAWKCIPVSLSSSYLLGQEVGDERQRLEPCRVGDHGMPVQNRVEITFSLARFLPLKQSYTEISRLLSQGDDFKTHSPLSLSVLLIVNQL